jgi:hypothetical protein
MKHNTHVTEWHKAQVQLRYTEKLALLNEIKESPEVRKEIAAMRRRERLLEHTTRTTNGNEFQGYANRKGTNLEPYAIGHFRGGESLVSSDSFEACVISGMAKAEDNSRNIADNN